VTPVDFVDQFISRLSDVLLDAGERAAVKRHAVTFIAMCAAGNDNLYSHNAVLLL